MSDEQWAIPVDLKPVPASQTFETLTEVAPAIWVVDGALDSEFCNHCIEKFEASPQDQSPGLIGYKQEDPTYKRSMDVMVSILPNWRAEDEVFVASLREQIPALIERITVPGARMQYGDWFCRDTGYQMQKTTPGGGYKWHVENEGRHTVARSLTILWYLNDVTEGGDTGFWHQKAKVQPRTGRVVLFNANWTHVHAGLPVVRGEKYICTGWLQYPVDGG